mmetsp:Transcript_83650/g.236099  ORF Transcript_83650/g.236099 Transcript_83650/m.236099 type:complete len:388 (+) Transcript_83650:1124-2287(+)
MLVKNTDWRVAGSGASCCRREHGAACRLRSHVFAVGCRRARPHLLQRSQVLPLVLPRGRRAQLPLELGPVRRQRHVTGAATGGRRAAPVHVHGVHRPRVVGTPPAHAVCAVMVRQRRRRAAIGARGGPYANVLHHRHGVHEGVRACLELVLVHRQHLALEGRVRLVDLLAGTAQLVVLGDRLLVPLERAPRLLKRRERRHRACRGGGVAAGPPEGAAKTRGKSAQPFGRVRLKSDLSDEMKEAGRPIPPMRPRGRRSRRNATRTLRCSGAARGRASSVEVPAPLQLHVAVPPVPQKRVRAPNVMPGLAHVRSWNGLLSPSNIPPPASASAVAFLWSPSISIAQPPRCSRRRLLSMAPATSLVAWPRPWPRSSSPARRSSWCAARASR